MPAFGLILVHFCTLFSPTGHFWWNLVYFYTSFPLHAHFGLIQVHFYTSFPPIAHFWWNQVHLCSSSSLKLTYHQLISKTKTSHWRIIHN